MDPVPKPHLKLINSNVLNTNNPKYQTLDGLGGVCFGADKKGGGGGGAGPKAPPAAEQLKRAGTNDPKYQTFAGVCGDVFGADKKR